MSCSHADPGGDRGAGLGSDPFDRRAAETHLRPGTVMKHSGSSSRILSWRLPRSRENQFHFALSPVRRVCPSWGRGGSNSLQVWRGIYSRFSRAGHPRDGSEPRRFVTGALGCGKSLAAGRLEHLNERGNQMRIVYVDPQGYPSATPGALQTFHTCIGLAAHTERIWLVGGRGSSEDAAAFYGLPQPANLNFWRLPRFQRKRGWIRLAWSTPFHVLALAVVRHLVREAGITAVLVRNLKLAQFLLRVHRRRPLPPIVFESHQIFGDTLKEGAIRQRRDLSAKWRRVTAREAEVYRDAAGLLVLTEHLAVLLRERFATRGRIKVVPDGVDPRAALPVAST